MKYFKNTDLAKLHGISEKTVRNWIDASLKGKLDIELYLNGKRAYVADTTNNAFTIKKLVAEGKKYRNSRIHKIVNVKPQFHELYTDEQIIDILHNLERLGEFPFQYTHMGQGAIYTEEYYLRLHEEKILNSQQYASRALCANAPYITSLLRHELVNVIEIGGRTGMVAKNFLEGLQQKGVLCEYVDLDSSQEMLDKNKRNMLRWFGNTNLSTGYMVDIAREQFREIIFKHSLKDKPIANLVLFLGGTMFNLARPAKAFQMIHSSLGTDDVLVISFKLDTSKAREYFDFSGQYVNELLDPQSKMGLQVLGIEDALYNVEQLYDKTSRARKIQVRFKFDVSINFNLSQHKQIDFKKGETLLLWRYWHKTLEEVEQELREVGFNILQATKSPDEQYAMIIAKVKRERG